MDQLWSVQSVYSAYILQHGFKIQRLQTPNSATVNRIQDYNWPF